jgi:hypothetical protein
MLTWNLGSARIDEDRFWDFVGEVVEEVFDGRGGDRIEPIRRQLAGRPDGEQALFNHREPLDVPGQLAAVDEIDEAQMKRYRRLKITRRWAVAP